MTLSMAQSIVLLILAIFAIIVLLKVLFIVHKQTNRVKELEMQMKAMEKIDAQKVIDNELNGTTEK